MSKKNIILTIITILLFIVAVILGISRYERIELKNQLENSLLSFASKNEKTIFTINKITYFSSCDAKNKEATTSNFTIENLYQYTDMAILISSPDEEKTLENTLKSVYIDNIKYEKYPNLGEPKLYYKNINDFAKSDIIEENLIKDKLEFEVTSADEADLSKPVLYNNLANPIVLSNVTSNIKTDYTITDTSKPITYDGSLLRTCNVLLNNIACKISFDIYITNNMDQKFKATVFANIPLDIEGKSIYDGSITLKENTNIDFYRYE